MKKKKSSGSLRAKSGPCADLPINPPPNQPTDRPTNQRNQRMNLLTNLCSGETRIANQTSNNGIHEPRNKPTNPTQSTIPPTHSQNKYVNKPISQPVNQRNQPIDHIKNLTKQPNNQTRFQPTINNEPTDQSTIQRPALLSLLILLLYSASQPPNPSMIASSPINRIAKSALANQRQVFYFTTRPL